MFLERIAVFTLQVRAKVLTLFHYLLRETDSQLGQIFFTCCLIFLTWLLLYTWITAYALWFKISFTIVYLVSSLLCVTAIYFIVKRKRIRTSSKTLQVYTLNDDSLGTMQQFNLKAIALTNVQADAVFKAFSVKYLDGTFQSFQSLIHLKPVSLRKRLVWKDLSPKRAKQVNRQTLLEFLSQLMIGFENLENNQIKELVDHYFILKNPVGSTQTLSTKNISDWRTNKAAYLKEISKIFQQHL
ncbi:hypothetical protein GCM10007103_00090 [Salinimicrobium marinum]|uniref:Uncharacterized protein n=1 Tax=Salinimicrobium marinum TaxID=680283 RepID=A0A918S669_9FLAO|nr:hypothetical protein GCM10007103_00090 [Salinimicrobium marinum]